MSDQEPKQNKKRLDSAAVMELVYEWLRMIPKINKYFLEQEAKIKTDKIVKYAETVGADPANVGQQKSA